jgi:glycosyltransferase involved in cell wall biosynthesis
MKVSIITVTYNSERTLEDTIKSVIAQDYPNIEYVIIDGQSKDGTMSIVEKYENHIAKVVSEPDRGLYDAMNKGWKYATGDIIGYINSDDFLNSRDAISSVVEAFKSDDSLDGVHADLYYVDADDTSRVIRYWKTSEYTPGAFKYGWHPAHPTFYARRDCYEKLGGFRLDLPLSADFELMLRFIEVNRLKTRHINKVLVRMRLGGATSRNIMSILHGIVQCRHAFRVNGIKVPFYYPIVRLFPKLKQFVNK